VKVWFYDVSKSHELSALNGRLMTFDELVQHHHNCRSDWPELVLDDQKFLSFDFHPYGAGELGWRNWGRYFATAVQLFTGHCPSKEEIQIAKGFVMGFSHEEKVRLVNKQFILCFLPYLFIGLKMHQENRFRDDSNSIEDVRNFVLSLWSQQRVLMSTFLCSHRDPKTGSELNLLQTNIPDWKVRRSISMLLGILNNCQTLVRGRLAVIQQGPSANATSTVFPEITVAYIEKGNLQELLATINWQYEYVRKLLGSINGGKVSLGLYSTDCMNRRLEELMSTRFGGQWRTKDFLSFAELPDPLVRIGVDHVLPSIRRLISFFEGDTQSRFHSQLEDLVLLNRTGDGEQANMAESIIREFARNYTMNLGAKAVHEAGFYYLWGRYCGMTNAAFAIGLDRDHDVYQYLAWSLGAASVQGSVPKGQQRLLSARRNPKGLKHGILTDLSFRQFWRHDDQ
jgi:hypothetical protein